MPGNPVFNKLGFFNKPGIPFSDRFTNIFNKVELRIGVKQMFSSDSLGIYFSIIKCIFVEDKVSNLSIISK